MPSTHPDTNDFIPILNRVPLFAGLHAATMSALARASRIQRVPKGHLIFNQGDSGEAAYVVRSGAVVISLNTSDGRELIINEMHAGDCFGELALLTPGPHTASAIAHQASELIVIPREAFLTNMEQEPQLMEHLLETLAERLRASSERESALAFLDAPARVARALLHIEREQKADGVVRVSQDEIAQRVGIARQTVAKILGDWRRHGWIITGRGRIMLLNRAHLRKCAEELET